MSSSDGRNATKPYRVRVGSVWYRVDPAVLRSALEPGDVILVYPVTGDPVLAILQQDINAPEVAAAGAVGLSSLEGEHFAMPLDEIAALHLTAVDDVQ
jgi:hypothetical protein